MGANAQTTVPTFTAGQVLTADQQNQSARTGVPVFATTVERDAAFGGSGEKTLAEGQLAYIENLDVVQYYSGAAWATVGPAAASGLTFINGATFTTAATVSTPAGTFSATYKNYVVVLNITASSTTQNVSMRVNASGSPVTTANYIGGFVTVTDVGALSNFSGQGTTSMPFINVTNTAFSVFEIGNPVDAAIRTDIVGRSSGNAASTSRAGAAGGFAFNAAGGHDGVTFFVAGTITGFYKVYGLADS